MYSSLKTEKHDRLGSVRQIINTSGNVVRYYTYEPFGETIEQTSDGSLATSDGFMFTGQYFDTEIDQYYLRARQYDPHISRFTARDPVFGKFEEPLTLHKYLYCINDPINKIDAFGREYQDINFTWTYGIVPGMIHGAISGSGGSWIGASAGAAIGGVLGGFGFTGGLMVEKHEAHIYLGPSWTTNLSGGTNFALTVCPNPETIVDQGWYLAYSVGVAGAFHQGGMHLKTGATFSEVGITGGITGMGPTLGTYWGVSLFYSFPGIRMPSFSGHDSRSVISDLDLLDRAIMMNTMREDTAELLQGGIAGIGFISVYGVTADQLLGM